MEKILSKKVNVSKCKHSVSNQSLSPFTALTLIMGRKTNAETSRSLSKGSLKGDERLARENSETDQDQNADSQRLDSNRSFENFAYSSDVKRDAFEREDSETTQHDQNTVSRRQDSNRSFESFASSRNSDELIADFDVDAPLLPISVPTSPIKTPQGPRFPVRGATNPNRTLSLDIAAVRRGGLHRCDASHDGSEHRTLSSTPQRAERSRTESENATNQNRTVAVHIPTTRRSLRTQSESGVPHVSRSVPAATGFPVTGSWFAGGYMPPEVTPEIAFSGALSLSYDHMAASVPSLLFSSVESVASSDTDDADRCTNNVAEIVENHDLESQQNHESHCHLHNRFCRDLNRRVRTASRVYSMSRADGCPSESRTRRESLNRTRHNSLLGSNAYNSYGAMGNSYGALGNSYATSRRTSLMGSLASVYDGSVLNFDFDHFVMSARTADYERSICCAYHLQKVGE